MGLVWDQNLTLITEGRLHAASLLIVAVNKDIFAREGFCYCTYPFSSMSNFKNSDIASSSCWGCTGVHGPLTLKSVLAHVSERSSARTAPSFNYQYRLRALIRHIVARAAQYPAGDPSQAPAADDDEVDVPLLSLLDDGGRGPPLEEQRLEF